MKIIVTVIKQGSKRVCNVIQQNGHRDKSPEILLHSKSYNHTEQIVLNRDLAKWY